MRPLESPYSRSCRANRCTDSPRIRIGLIIASLIVVPWNALTRADNISVAPGFVDVDDTDGACSLIEAIENAQDTLDGELHLDCGPGDPSGVDTVQLDPGSVYVMTQADNSSWGGNGLPLIVEEVVLQGNNATLERSNSAGGFRMLFVNTSGLLTLNDVVLRNGAPAGSSRHGGALRNHGTTVLNRCTLEFNAGSLGGAAYNVGDLTLNDCRVVNNTASISGGAVFNSGQLTIYRTSMRTNYAGANGGGLFNGNTADVELDSSTLSENEAGGGDGGAVRGGGTVTAVNCTFSLNDAGDLGGGLFVAASGDLSLANCTVTGNSGSNIQLHATSSSTLQLASTLVSASEGGANCVPGAGVVVDSGFNVIEDASCLSDPTSMGVDPMLGPLEDNGGMTHTHALLPDSPAIDWGECDDGGMVEDQRGIARPQGVACDVGAFELVEAELSIDNQGASEGSQNLSFFVERTHNSHDVSVDVTTHDVSTQAGSDFAVLSQTVSLPSGGPLSIEVVIELYDDDVVEHDEYFEVRLTNPLQSVVAVGVATGTILNDDTVNVSFDAASSEVEESSTTHEVAVRMDGMTDVDLSVDVVDGATGSATEGTDYEFFGTQTVTFAAGSVDGTVGLVFLQVVDDDLEEPEETVSLTVLDSADPAVTVLGPDSHTVAIMASDQQEGVLQVAMDINPDECPNSYPTRARGFMQAALLGSEDFDVSQVRLGSLALLPSDGTGEGVRPLYDSRSWFPRTRDIAGARDADGCDCAGGGPDGHPDLRLKFDREMLTSRLGFLELSHGSTVELMLVGMLDDGTTFQASDCIVIKGGNQNVPGFSRRPRGNREMHGASPRPHHRRGRRR